MVNITKHNPRVEVRPSTIEDVQKFYGKEKLPFTVRAISFFLDGELAGIGGVRFHNGAYIAFSDMLDTIKPPPATIYRCGIEVMKMIKSTTKEVYAIKEERLVTAERFLSSLGFKHVLSADDGDFYKWQQ